MSQQDKPNTAKQEGVGEYSAWWSKDNPTRQCTTHHNACNCREEKFQKLEAALKDAQKALEFYANRKNWESRWYDSLDGNEDNSGDIFDIIDISDVEIQNDESKVLHESFNGHYTHGGKRARLELEKIKKVLG